MTAVLLAVAAGVVGAAVASVYVARRAARQVALANSTADRLLQELRQVSTRYGVRRIQCVDNILDMNYLRTFLPRGVKNWLRVARERI